MLGRGEGGEVAGVDLATNEVVVPPPEIRRLRDLTRYRRALVEDRNREVNRIHKLPEDAGSSSPVVSSDVMRASGRAVLASLVGGTADPEALLETLEGLARSEPIRPCFHDAAVDPVSRTVWVVAVRNPVPVDIVDQVSPSPADPSPSPLHGPAVLPTTPSRS